MESQPKNDDKAHHLTMFEPEASGNHPQGLTLNVSKAVRTTKESNGLRGVTVELISQNVALFPGEL
jgi:hypothetical protein